MENTSKEWNRESVQKLIEECKENGWMFSFIVAVTNISHWVLTREGTAKMFSKEDNARGRFWSSLADDKFINASKDEQIAYCKKFSEEYLINQEES